MEITLMHILIDQALQRNESYVDTDHSPDEKDIVINSETYKLVGRIVKGDSLSDEENQFVSDVTRILKKYEEVNTSIGREYSTCNLPDDYMHLLSDESVLFTERSTTKIVPNSWYKALTEVKYNGIWYDKDSVIVGNNRSDYYGDIVELCPYFVENRLYPSSKIHTILRTQYEKTTVKSPVSELIGKQLRVYQNNFTVRKVRLGYYRKPVDVNYRKKIDSEFPDNVQYYIIDRVVAKLSTINEQGEQKIQNIKSDIII